MLLFLFTFRYFTVLFHTILRFPGQSFTVLRTSIIESTTFTLTNSYKYKKLDQMGNLYEKPDRKLVQYLLMGKWKVCFERRGLNFAGC